MKNYIYIGLLAIIFTSNIQASNITPMNPRLTDDNIDKIITTCNLKELKEKTKTCFPQNVDGYNESIINVNKIPDFDNYKVTLRTVWANTLNIRELGINTKDLADNINYIGKSLENERFEFNKEYKNDKYRNDKNHIALNSNRKIEVDYTTFFGYKTPYQYDLEYIELVTGKENVEFYKKLNKKIKENATCEKDNCISTVISMNFITRSNQAPEHSEDLENYIFNKYFKKNIKNITINKKNKNFRFNVHMIYTVNGEPMEEDNELIYKKSLMLDNILDTGELSYE